MVNLQNYKLLIYKKALIEHKHSGIEFDECHQRAYLISAKAYLTFNENRKVLFSTYLYKSLDNSLHKSVKKEKKLISEEEDQQYIVEHTAKKDKQFDLIDFLDYLYKSLSDKSIKIIKLIFDPKVNIKNILNKNYTYNAYGSKLTKDAIKKYLLKKGWKDNDIRNCFKEIRFALKEWEYVR